MVTRLKLRSHALRGRGICLYILSFPGHFPRLLKSCRRPTSPAVPVEARDRAAVLGIGLPATAWFKL